MDGVSFKILIFHAKTAALHIKQQKIKHSTVNKTATYLIFSSLGPVICTKRSFAPGLTG
jgi:hypothetical protein